MTREADPTRHLQPAPFPEESLGEYLPVNAGRPRAAAPQMVDISAVESALARLETTLDEETAGLKARAAVDLEEINRRKSRSLLELTRLSRNLPAGAEIDLRDAVDRVRTKLRDNQRTVDLHVSAVREIADMMATALSEAESDGTYALGARK